MRITWILAIIVLGINAFLAVIDGNIHSFIGWTGYTVTVLLLATSEIAPKEKLK